MEQYMGYAEYWRRKNTQVGFAGESHESWTPSGKVGVNERILYPDPPRGAKWMGNGCQYAIP